jgi:hypothetical protein
MPTERVYINTFAKADGVPATLSYVANGEIFDTRDYKRARVAIETGIIPPNNIPVCRFSDIKDMVIGYRESTPSAKSVVTLLSSAVQNADNEIYSVSAVIDMINITIRSLFTKSQPPPVARVGDLPQFGLDNGQGIYVDMKEEFASHYELSGDSQFYTLLLSGFSSRRSPSESYYSVPIKAGKTLQEFSTYPNFFMYDKILIETDLPTRPAHVAFTGAQASTMNLLTTINILTPDLRSALFIVPNFMRWIDLQVGPAVRQIGVRVHYQSRTGEIFPLTLQQNSRLSLHLLFSLDESE